MLHSYHSTSLQWTCLLLCFAQSVSTGFCFMLLLLIHQIFHLSKNFFWDILRFFFSDFLAFPLRFFNAQIEDAHDDQWVICLFLNQVY